MLRPGDACDVVPTDDGDDAATHVWSNELDHFCDLNAALLHSALILLDTDSFWKFFCAADTSELELLLDFEYKLDDNIALGI